jgi:hypothetical protein
MPPIYTVRAEVIDIRTDTPVAMDALLVDTNVWFWHAYPDVAAIAGAATPSQMGDYTRRIRDSADAGATLYHTAVSLAELAHLIEQHERDVYASAVAPVTAKEYRHNLPAERTRIAGVVQRAWSLVQADSLLLSLILDAGAIHAALGRFATQKVDGYDLFLLEAMSAAGVSQVLTDDGDYGTVPGIQVFTANPRVIAAARSAGLLVTR